jgi:hypothetical protein
MIFALLIILALLLFIAGLFLSFTGTMGIALICAACLIGIFARLRQASVYQNQLVAALYEIALKAYQQQEKK